MTITLVEKVATQAASQMVGKRIEKVSNAHGSFLMLECGNSVDIIYSDGSCEKRREWLLWCYQCVWRLEKKNRVLIGALDDQDEIREKIPILQHKTILSIKINPHFLDIEIIFSGNLALRCFSSKLDEEQWVLYRPDGLAFSASTLGDCTLEE